MSLINIVRFAWFPIIFVLGVSGIPENPSSRIVFLFLLLLSVFLLTSYSAIIVSLLQTTSSAINSISELMNSQFKLSMRNITYSITYVNVSVFVGVNGSVKLKL